MDTVDNDIKVYSCPFCKSKAKLLKGNTRRRYFCSNCFVEFTANDKCIERVFQISESGDLEEITEWKEYIKERG